MVKYAPLGNWLAAQHSRREVTLSFSDVEGVIGGALPRSAHDHQAWWSNTSSHVQAVAWLRAGWVVDAFDLRRGWVRFCRSASAGR